MRINRLVETTVLLLNRKSVKARDLAERFGVSVRTVYRDIEELSVAGIPVYMTKGRGGGISLLQEYSLDKALLSERDKESVILALKTLQATKYPAAGSALEKIGAVLRGRATDTADEWVRVDFTRWGSDPNEGDKFAQIKAAILDRRVITFKYVDRSGTRTTRELEPMTLMNKGQAWYLYGFCRLRADFRVLRISRIKDLVSRDERFERRPVPTFSNLDFEDSTRREVRLMLRFSPDVVHRVYDDFDDQDVKPNLDGTMDVTTSFPEDEWVYGYILSFGKAVQVLEPPDVRANVIKRFKEAVLMYGSSRKYDRLVSCEPAMMCLCQFTAGRGRNMDQGLQGLQNQWRFVRECSKCFLNGLCDDDLDTGL